MPLSYSTYTGDGSTTSFAITFDYLSETVVVGTSPAGILVYLDEVKQTSGYSLVGSNIVFSSAPGASVDIRIVRSTPRGKSDRLVDYEDSTTLTSALLDTSALQLLYIAQEAFEQSSSGGGATPTYLPYSTTLAAWDAESQKISRVATPATGTDAVNKTYADDGFLPFSTSADTYDASRSSANKKIDGVEDPQGNQQAATKKYVDDVATWGIAGVPQSFKFTADGATNSFTLTSAPYAEAEMLVVGLDGVLQLPTDDYTVTGGATNSTLNFVSYTPTSGQVINVLNFGKARFLDSALLEDNSIATSMLQDSAVTAVKIADLGVTTAKLADQGVTTAKLADSNVTTAKIADTNVTTAKLATDAVTEAKIADDSVDFARLKDTGFMGAANANSTAQVLRVNTGTANLTAGTLAAADITDFNSSVTAQPISAFAAAAGTVNMDSNFLTNLPDPTAAQHAATKAYVDASAQSAFKGTLITDTTLASASGTFEVSGWFDDSKYLHYELVCMNFRVSDPSGFVGVLTADSSGSYANGSSAYKNYSSVFTVTTTTRSAICTPSLSNTTSTGQGYTNFVLRLPFNNSASAAYKSLEVKGAGHSSSSGALPLFNGFSEWSIASQRQSTNTIQKVRFWCIDSVGDTGASGSIRAGARVLVYGYEGLS